MLNSPDVYQVEGNIEEILMKQQRADLEQIYPEPLDSISSEISSTFANKKFGENLGESDDERYV